MKRVREPTSAARLATQPFVSGGIAKLIGADIRSCLTTENQAEDKANPEGGKDRLGRIFAHILFAIFLKTAGAIAGVVPHLFGPAAILICDGAGRRFESSAALRAWETPLSVFSSAAGGTASLTLCVTLFSSVFSLSFFIGLNLW